MLYFAYSCYIFSSDQNAKNALPAIQEEALNAEHRPTTENKASDNLVVIELAQEQSGL
jgi:hypothetical protein